MTTTQKSTFHTSWMFVTAIASMMMMMMIVAMAIHITIEETQSDFWIIRDYEAYAQENNIEDEDREGRENIQVQQRSIISVTTDKAEYSDGDAIIISGEIRISLAETPVILQIFKDNNPIYINQITPANDNTYWDIVRAEGVKWTRSGEYEIAIRYGTDGKAVTKFNFVPSTAANQNNNGNTISNQNMEVDAGNETFDVLYSITGGTINDMTLDWRDFTLVVEVNVTDRAGSITMDLPRKYIGAEVQRGGSTVDESFIILIDGVQVDYKEGTATNSETRKVTIDLLKGDSEIRIIGTYAVPEFEHIIIIIMLAGIMLALVILSRTKRYSKMQIADVKM